MLTCKEYIFKLTSGQLAEAGKIDRLWAWQHRLICRRCRTFTENDQTLSHLLDQYREQRTGAKDEPGAG